MKDLVEAYNETKQARIEYIIKQYQAGELSSWEMAVTILNIPLTKQGEKQ